MQAKAHVSLGRVTGQAKPVNSFHDFWNRMISRLVMDELEWWNDDEAFRRLVKDRS